MALKRKRSADDISRSDEDRPLTPSPGLNNHVVVSQGNLIEVARPSVEEQTRTIISHAMIPAFTRFVNSVEIWVTKLAIEGLQENTVAFEDELQEWEAIGQALEHFRQYCDEPGVSDDRAPWSVWNGQDLGDKLVRARLKGKLMARILARIQKERTMASLYLAQELALSIHQSGSDNRKLADCIPRDGCKNLPDASIDSGLVTHDGGQDVEMRDEQGGHSESSQQLEASALPQLDGSCSPKPTAEHAMTRRRQSNARKDGPNGPRRKSTAYPQPEADDPISRFVLQAHMQLSKPDDFNLFAQPVGVGVGHQAPPPDVNGQKLAISQPAMPRMQRPQSHRVINAAEPIPPESAEDEQTLSTAVQYQEALELATARAAARKAAHPSHTTNMPNPDDPNTNATDQAQTRKQSRQPWSTPEVQALMSGLDRAQGPHWSSIQSMYGISGSISSVLASRTQVQLKDKARNLKMLFLKQGLEVPKYLREVTGELGRGGRPKVGKARGVEPEEGANSIDNEEERARDDAIAALVLGRNDSM